MARHGESCISMLARNSSNDGCYYELDYHGEVDHSYTFPSAPAVKSSGCSVQLMKVVGSTQFHTQGRLEMHHEREDVSNGVRIIEQNEFFSGDVSSNRNGGACSEGDVEV